MKIERHNCWKLGGGGGIMRVSSCFWIQLQEQCVEETAKNFAFLFPKRIRKYCWSAFFSFADNKKTSRSKIMIGQIKVHPIQNYLMQTAWKAMPFQPIFKAMSFQPIFRKNYITPVRIICTSEVNVTHPVFRICVKVFWKLGPVSTTFSHFS